MTPQDHAMLAIWQLQARAGVPASARRLPRLPTPANDPDSFERDLEEIRRAMGEANA